MKSNTLCVIMARGKSKRVPRKNIRMLLGKPLIAYTIEAALESKLCEKIVVSTEDTEIAKVAKECGVDALMRPEELALDTSALEDGLRHSVRIYQQQSGIKPDIVVMLQANLPVRKKGEIDQMIKKLQETEGASAIVTGYVVSQRPEWMKTIDESGKIKPFLKPSKFYRKQDLPELVLLDGAAIAVKTKVLMESEGVKGAHVFFGDEVYMIVRQNKYATDIDEEEDFEIAEYYLRKANDSHIN